MLSDSRNVMAIPQPTGWPRSVARLGSSRVRPAAESRATNIARHTHPDTARAAANAVEVTVPAKEMARMAPATNASRTTGTRRACTSAPACVRASSGRTTAASSRLCKANAQKAKRHSPAVANAPPINGPHSADAVHTTDRQAMMRGTIRFGKKRSWAM